MRKPEFFSMIKNRRKWLTKEQIINDIIAGSVVAIIALPLSIAIGISSGVSPSKGLLTAILASLCISLFGGSRVQIAGPTGGFVVIVYGIIQKHGFGGLLVATLMAGVILIFLGVLKLGNLIKYIPKSIILGFTAGIGVTLFVAQIQEFLGLKIEKIPTSFVGKLEVYLLNIRTISLVTLIIGLVAVGIIIFFPKVNKIIPSSLVALICVTGVVVLFNVHTATVGSTFGKISSAIPIPKIPDMTLENIQSLIFPAITIAFLGYLQALLTAVVTDDMLGHRHNSNTELVSQGVANIVLALFGGIPATGAIARSTASVRSGGRTPIVGLVHSAILLIIMLLFVSLLQYVPLAVLAGILIVVSYNMCSWDQCIKLVKENKIDGFELILTLVLTVFLNLVIAIIVAMIFHIIRMKFFNNEIQKKKSIKKSKLSLA